MASQILPRGDTRKRKLQTRRLLEYVLEETANRAQETALGFERRNMSESDGAEVESAQKDQICETEGQTADVAAPEIAEEEEEDNDAASTASTSQSGRTESQVVGKKRKLKFVFEESDKGQQRIKALKITREGQPEHLIERSPLGVSADERSHLTHGDVTCLFQVLQQLHDKSRSASATDVALPAL